MPYKDKDKQRLYKRNYIKQYRKTLDPQTKRLYNLRTDLKRNYNLTIDEYQEMFVNQEGRCDICKTEFSEEIKMNIDHDHTTGQIRGLLCHGCNTGIGLLGEDPKRMIDAALYLIKSAAPQLDN